MTTPTLLAVFAAVGIFIASPSYAQQQGGSATGAAGTGGGTNVQPPAQSSTTIKATPQTFQPQTQPNPGGGTGTTQKPASGGGSFEGPAISGGGTTAHGAN